MRGKKLFQGILPLILVFALVLTGCGSIETSNTSKQKSDPVQFVHKVYSETVKDEDGTVLLDLKITYPNIENPGKDSSIAAINEYYELQVDSFVKNIMKDRLEQAKADKEWAQNSEYEFRPHTYDQRAEIHYNGNNLLSVLNLQYENTGGAHPMTYWLSETFDLKTGKKLALTDILGGSKEEALEKVYETVFEKIKAAEGTEDFYFNESWQDDLRKSYGENDFVLTENGLRFYYQLYSLGPYVAGFKVFDLPYDKMISPALTIPILPKSQLESDLYEQVGMLIDRNKEAYFEIFGLSMLNMNVPEKRAEKEFLFPVTDERFTTLTDLEQFVRGTYTKSVADSLLASGKYSDVNGKLHGDISKDTGVGYYVDWNNYAYKINDITETSATLTIFTTDDSPAGKKDIEMTTKMVKEGDYWLLGEMVN